MLSDEIMLDTGKKVIRILENYFDLDFSEYVKLTTIYNRHTKEYETIFYAIIDDRHYEGAIRSVPSDKYFDYMFKLKSNKMGDVQFHLIDKPTVKLIRDTLEEAKLECIKDIKSRGIGQYGYVSTVYTVEGETSCVVDYLG